jgi:cardiolipin synthase
MTEHLLASLWAVLIFVTHIAFAARAVLRPHREPASRVAWVVVIMIFPLVGIVAYMLLGETSIGRRQAARMR